MIVLFNPRSSDEGKAILPMSILSLAAVLDGKYAYDIVDGNPVDNPLELVRQHCREGARILAITVMPGRQVRQAIEVSRSIKAEFPDVLTVWGGYFPTMYPDVCITESYVDFIFRGHTEISFVALVDALSSGSGWRNQAGLSWVEPGSGTVHHNPEGPVPNVNSLPDFPYEKVNMEGYMLNTFLGSRTVPYHASYGCPFTCNFCGVVNMVGGRYSAQDADRLGQTVEKLVGHYGANAVQFFDNNFFVSEARTVAICEVLKPYGISWWAYARIDTLMKYRDRTWELMRDSGLKMAFLGAEAGSDEALRQMNKGGRQNVDQALAIAARMRDFDIIPEMSFVIGSPPDPVADIDRTFTFIRRVKSINPAAEIVLYLYTPVPVAGDLYEQAKGSGFVFPTSLDEWAEDKWVALAERRSADLPWLSPSVRRKISNFQRVLHAAYPTSTDPGLTGARRLVLKLAGQWRYRLGIYVSPLELRLLNRLLPHQRPEVAGF